MNELDSLLYKTRKNVLEIAAELGDNSISLGDISLEQCNSCGVWLKPSQLKPDLDDLRICKDCEGYYGL